MRVAVDAMGGDYAPSEVVEGAIKAYQENIPDREIVLVGDQFKIREELKKKSALGLNIAIHHAPEVIEMHESPVLGVRTKQKASIVEAVELVKKKQAEAVVSAGNTGAVVVSSQIKLRTLPGIERPAIATVMPSQYGPFLVLDVGANSDCKSKHLAQFAVMGDIYAKYILKKENPRIGLLSIGEEETKGNELTKEAFSMIEKENLNFIGNIEGKDFFAGTVDVIVCDGFVGNVVLKACESLAHALQKIIKKEIKSSLLGMMGGLLVQPAFKNVKKITDYSEYGGTPLLGVNGTCIIAHGNSNSHAVKNAINVAYESFQSKVNQHITDSLINF